MSLLMEALRKAEEAKRRAAQEDQGTSAGLTPETPDQDTSLDLEPAPAREDDQWQEPDVVQESSADADTFASLKLADMPDSPAEKDIPDFMLETQSPAPAVPDLSWLDNDQPYNNQPPEPEHEPIPEPVPEPVNQARIIEKIVAESRQEKTSAADVASSKRSARAVFAAKSKRTKSSKTRVAVLLCVLGLILVSGLGLWLLPALTNTGSQFNVPPSFDPVAYQPFDSAVDNETDNNAVDVSSVEPVANEPEIVRVEIQEPELQAPEIAEAETQQIIPPAQIQEVAPAQIVEVPALVTSTTAAAEVQTPVQTAVIQAPSSPIQISRSSPMRNPDMQMFSAWSAYQQGDYAAARILYQQSLARDPDNRDALLGVAASALQQGDIPASRQAYSHLLSMNPRDPLARTGLLETTASNDLMQREIELKALLTDYPDMAAISYSLGNLYMGQQRWHDAQQSYYNALLAAKTQANGPVSPDYAFNLAVSLERINQPRAALDYYREARSLSEQHAASFDSYVLEQRLQALERTLP